MAADVVLLNGTIVVDGRLVQVGIALDEGRIIKIAKKTNLPRAVTQIDLDGKLALPGLVDCHVHLRDQQLSYREDFETGTMAAAAGGVTTVVDMPNNQPLTMSAQTLEERMSLAKRRIFVNVGFNSALPKETEEIQRIVIAGAVGFKLFLLQQLGGVNVDDDEALLKAFKRIRKTGVPIAVHAEDRLTIDRTRDNLEKQGRQDLDAFLEAHPPKAEEKAVERVTRLANESQAHPHICHVSSAVGLKAVVKAKRAGIPLTCEVTPHHLLLTTKQLRKVKGLALELPPLRTRKDVDALWTGLQRGLIDTIGSDHAPHSLEEKNADSAWNIKPGIVGLETMLPLMLTEVNRGRLTLEELIRLTCEKPAEIYHLRSRGQLVKGAFADITVVDMKKEFKIDASKFYSKSKFSPFDGWKVKGKPVKTFVNGGLVMDEGEIVAKPGSGRIVK